MAELQQAAARAILEDPDVDTLSSFIGVDANNTMLHTGRMLINLKRERSSSQQDTMDRLKARAAKVAGVTLYVQPTQDLTIDAETGPTQFRLSLEGVDNAVVVQWAGKLAERMQTLASVRNIASDAGSSGTAAYITIDRDTASRIGVTTSSISDDALYSAFASASSRPSLPRDQPVPRDSGGHARPVKHAGSAGQSPTQNQLGRNHAAVGHCHHHRAPGTAANHARRPVPGDHAGL